MVFTTEYNGYTGVGKTQRQADIACCYAAAYLNLSGTSEDKTAVFGDLPGWNGEEEDNYKIVTGVL